MELHLSRSACPFVDLSDFDEEVGDADEYEPSDCPLQVDVFERDQDFFEDQDVEDPNREDLGTLPGQPAVNSGVSPAVDGVEWNNILSRAFPSVAARAPGLSLPWETGAMRQIFDSRASCLQLPSMPGDSTDLSFFPSMGTTAEHIDRTLEFDASIPAYQKAVRNYKDMEYFEDKRTKLALAAGKWMDILSIRWDASSVGAQIVGDLKRDPIGILAEQTLIAVFGVKSPSTLLKRAGSMSRFFKWFANKSIDSDVFASPLPLDEAAVWEYFIHLREVRNVVGRGFTSCSEFLETVRFCKFVMGMHSCDEIVNSKRLLGFAAIEKRLKGPTKQAEPLNLDHLFRLHQILEHGANDIDRLGAGCFLVAIYGRARWSDLRYIDHVVNRGFRRNATVDFYTTEHKTSSIGLRREQFLPIAVPIEGVVAGDWFAVFAKLYSDLRLNLEAKPLGPLLPAPRLGGGWHARPLTTPKAREWLRMLLHGCDGADKIRAHSMKATLCSWAAKAGFNKEHRATLSHHATVLEGSDVVYSRELQTRAIQKLQMLIKKVRLGLDPTANDMREEGNEAEHRGNKSVVFPETPGRCDVPATPAVLSIARQEAPVFISPKVEPWFIDGCEGEAEDLSLLPLSVVSNGLIAIDSSSGSCTTESSSGDEEEALGAIRLGHHYTEMVPEGFDFYKHSKSKRVHLTVQNERKSKCKMDMSGNFEKMPRVFHFKFPKCLRCFPNTTGRVRTRDDAVKALDDALKRVRSRD